MTNQNDDNQNGEDLKKNRGFGPKAKAKANEAFGSESQSNLSSVAQDLQKAFARWEELSTQEDQFAKTQNAQKSEIERLFKELQKQLEAF